MCAPVCSRALVANALFVTHMVAMAGLLGGFAGTTTSTVQLAAALSVKALWVQYIIALRPYASVLVLLVELVPSVMELLVLVFGLIQVCGVCVVLHPGQCFATCRLHMRQVV